MFGYLGTFLVVWQMSALANGAPQWALIMGVFALGTIPGLLSIGGLTSVIKGASAKKFFKFAGLVVILLALFNISNGYRLTGWKSLSSFLPRSSVKDNGL